MHLYRYTYLHCRQLCGERGVREVQGANTIWRSGSLIDEYYECVVLFEVEVKIEMELIATPL